MCENVETIVTVCVGVWVHGGDARWTHIDVVGFRCILECGYYDSKRKNMPLPGSSLNGVGPWVAW